MIRYLEKRLGERICGTDISNIARLINELSKRADYDKIKEKYGHKNLSALKKFLQFLRETGGVYKAKGVIKRDRPTATGARTDRSYQKDLFTVNTSSHSDYTEIERAWCKSVLVNDLNSVYLIGDEPDKENYIKAYEKISGQTLASDDEKKRAIGLIKEVGVQRANKVYCLVLEKESEDAILTFVSHTLESDGSVDFDVIKDKFCEILNGTSLTNSDLLKRYLEGAGFLCTKKRVYKSGCENKSILARVKSAIKSLDGVATIKDIERALPGTSQKSIKNVIRSCKDDFGNCGQEKYFLIEDIDISVETLDKIKRIIDKIISHYDVATDVLLYEALSKDEGILDDLFSRYPHLNNKNGVRAIVRGKLKDEYDIDNNLFVQKGGKIDMSGYIMRAINNSQQFQGNDLMDDLIKKGFSESFIFQFFCLGAVRLEEDTYINKNLVNFDIKNVDDTIESFLAGRDYMGLGEVTDWPSFGRAKYKWNGFLLESFLTHFSARYRLVNCYSKLVINGGYSKKRARGAIVKKESRYNLTGEIFSDILRRNNFETKKDFLDYLIERGYLFCDRKDVKIAWETR